MKILVGIITRNRVDRLEKCVESMLRHDFKYPLLVSDDNSMDGTIKYIQGRLCSDEYILNSIQGGVARNSNRILKEAKERKTDILFLLNDDISICDLDVFDLYIDAIQKSHYQHFCFTDSHSAFKPVEIFTKNGIEMHRRMFGDGVLLTITSSMLHCLGGFDTDYGIFGGEHYDYNRRAAAAGFCINSLDVPAAQKYIYAAQYYEEVKPSLPNVSEYQVAANMIWVERMSKPPEIYRDIII